MKKLTGSLRRWTYLTHRWCGVAGCLLMALWFVSGMVMLFIGYPKLTPWDRLAALPALSAAPKLPSQVMGDVPVSRLLLNAASGQARYIVQRADGSLIGNDVKGSIHQVGAALEGAPSCNGWTYWHFKREGKMIPIDLLRQQIRAELAGEVARPN